MKKCLSFFLCLLFVLTLCPSVYAAELPTDATSVDSSNLPTCSEEMIVEELTESEAQALKESAVFPNTIKQTRGFTQADFGCAPDDYKLIARYTILSAGAIKIEINSCIWDSPAAGLGIGLLTTDSSGKNVVYYHVYADGVITNKSLTYSNLSRGDYWLIVRNMSNAYVTGTIRYNILFP